jgi:hypothetical protein
MLQRRTALLFVVCVAIAAAAAADTKIVQQTHQDGFSVMGQTQPATDQEQVLWIGTDRMRMDQGETSVVVRLDLKKMYVLDHERKVANELELPLDLKEYLPEGMGEQMMQMMKFEASVEATGESKSIGDWNCKGYSVKLTSPMVSVEGTYWATADVDFDLEAYRNLYQEMISLQPGMREVVEEFEKIDGYVVEQDNITKMPMMGDTAIGMTQKTTSIDQLDPPAGTYDKPSDYELKPFDFMEMAQRRQQR